MASHCNLREVLCERRVSGLSLRAATLNADVATSRPPLSCNERPQFLKDLWPVGPPTHRRTTLLSPVSEVETYRIDGLVRDPNRAKLSQKEGVGLIALVLRPLLSIPRKLYSNAQASLPKDEVGSWRSR